MGFSKWALVELIEAAVRSGTTGPPPEPTGGWRNRRRPDGTDWALGMEARSRALLSDGDTPRPLPRGDRPARPHPASRPELARAHLLYGEWLRRDNRRADARAQLRTAHEMLDTMGLAAFAEPRPARAGRHRRDGARAHASIRSPR